jgi:hypothetical protein
MEPRAMTPVPAAQAALVCPSCSGPATLKSRHVVVTGSAVRVYCSEECLQVGDVVPEVELEEAPPPRNWPKVLGLTVGLGFLASNHIDDLLGLDVRSVATPELTVAAQRLATPPPSPAASPSADEAKAAAERADDEAFVSELLSDAWFHPLAGPERQMPHNHLQAFGAERPGDRPADCLSGHCGVDVGAGLWGEPVRAVHAGVVERVNRGPNEAHGGLYVRLSHRAGTAFTQYFHLAAIPRTLTPGTQVEAGQVIGLLGDSGIKQSAPHLHFTISVRPHKGAAERHLDPEPLLSIWPLWIDDEGPGGARVSTTAPPGMPARGRHKPAAKSRGPSGESPPAPAETFETAATNDAAPH